MPQFQCQVKFVVFKRTDPPPGFKDQGAGAFNHEGKHHSEPRYCLIERLQNMVTNSSNASCILFFLKICTPTHNSCSIRSVIALLVAIDAIFPVGRCHSLASLWFSGSGSTSLPTALRRWSDARCHSSPWSFAVDYASISPSAQLAGRYCL